MTHWPFVTVIICVMVAGVVFAVFSALEAEEVMARNMLSQARMLVETIDQERFSRLTATIADEQSQAYNDLRDTLVRIRTANPTYRYLYLMGKGESDPPFFYIGTAPAGTDEYSPPGQPYPEEAPTLAHVFATGEAALSDPVTDRWGTWVSALVPLRDKSTGRMLAVFGMDVDASDWQASIRLRTFLTGALTLVVVFLLLLLFFVLRNRQRSRTEYLLKESERRLSLAIAATADAIWEWNLQTGKTFYSPRWYEMLGYADREFPMDFDTWGNLCHPEDRACTVATIQKILAEPESSGYAAEFRMKSKSGDWVWILGRGNVVERDAEGTPLVVSGTNTDISERKQAEMALRESEDRFRNIMEQSTFSMMVLSPDGNVLNVNQAHTNLWGVSRELTKTFNILADPQLERLGLMPTIRRAMAGEQVSIPAVAYDLSATLGEGASKVVQGDFYPIRDANGAIHHIILIHQDISERKRMEEELRRHHENLEELVRERTAEAERATRAKGEFLANMSHEIRTPLNAVIGYSQLLQRDLTLGEKQQAALATIARSGEHLLRLINDILDMAKIESGRISLEPEDVELHVLLRDLESMFGLRAREKGLWLRIEMDPDVPRRVHIDARRLQQVLFNLLSNAVKFTRDGGVTLRAKADTWGRTRLRFEVEDTGLGISADEHPRLFVPFSQSASGRSVREGTGLGLAISRRLVELMGGTLSCSSAPGQGSVFGFDVVAPPAAADETPSERLQVVRLKPGTRPPRVLVVEDHADSRQVLVKLLSEAGFEVQEAADGLQALSRWEELAPEFIWMDINLPQLDGCEATQAIKKRAGGNGTIIVALTASAFDEDRRRIEACGIDGFLVKPYRETEIFETMGRLLGVEYEYREVAAPVAAAHSGGASLEGLPPDLRQRLRQTVLDLNVEGLRKLAGEVGACDPQLCRCVARAIESLDFSALLAAFDEYGGTDGT